jgi:hypothetical protein
VRFVTGWKEWRQRREASEPRLTVHVGGFAGEERQVTITVVLNNDGSTNLHGVVADALIDGKAVAKSEPVDVPSGGTKTVDIHVPRQYVVDLRGDNPIYTGEFSLRATGGWPERHDREGRVRARGDVRKRKERR